MSLLNMGQFVRRNIHVYIVLRFVRNSSPSLASSCVVAVLNAFIECICPPNSVIVVDCMGSVKSLKVSEFQTTWNSLLLLFCTCKFC